MGESSLSAKHKSLTPAHSHTHRHTHTPERHRDTCTLDTLTDTSAHTHTNTKARELCCCCFQPSLFFSFLCCFPPPPLFVRGRECVCLLATSSWATYLTRFFFFFLLLPFAPDRYLCSQVVKTADDTDHSADGQRQSNGLLFFGI